MAEFLCFYLFFSHPFSIEVLQTGLAGSFLLLDDDRTLPRKEPRHEPFASRAANLIGAR